MVEIHEVFTNLGRANSHAEKARALLKTSFVRQIVDCIHAGNSQS